MTKFFYSFRMRIIYLFILSLLLAATITFLLYKVLQFYYTNNVYYGDFLMYVRQVMVNIGDINVFLIIFVPLAIIIFNLLTRTYTKYLKEISLGINHLAAGDFSHQIKIESKDEFKQIASDINEASLRLKQAIEAEKLSRISKETLIANLAHDLRTPLTSVIGYLNLLKSGQSVGSKHTEEYVKTAYTKAKYLEELIETLFDISKLDLSLDMVDETEINIQELLHQLIEEMYPLVNEANAVVDAQIHKAIFVRGNGNELARVFENLLSNALRYGDVSEPIGIELLEIETNVHIQVSNKAEKLTEEDMAHLFDMFYTVDQARTSDRKQTGLGLFIAKTIIEKHRGLISARFENEKIYFEVVLPKA
ncbi:histidine kinase dimerization/phospho-acceptor domain-containing protein [Ornithinibacillus sp. 4-3]|uniref:histidine kinase n=1 Tax=Ornithinibacillus sp. 4-3 TaxID=3231488 RepID=A0AB39HL12_9BACI